jgi:hypothetical protein
LSLQSDILVSSLCFQMQLEPLHSGAALMLASLAMEAGLPPGGGHVNLNPVVTHSLNAPGFDPRAYKVKNWFQAFAFSSSSLCRYTAGY